MTITGTDRSKIKFINYNMMKATKTEDGIWKQPCPITAIPRAGALGSSQRCPAYSCLSMQCRVTMACFFSSWRQKEPNLIGSVRPVWPQNRNDDEPSQKWRSSSWFFNILKNGISDMHMLATAQGLILHPIFTSAEMEAWQFVPITATSLMNGGSSPTMMVYYGTIGFNGG